jgi:predicted nucleic acid-binding protein
VIIVSNASPLIILAKISYFHLPQRLFNEITISEDVWDEVVIKGAGLPGSAETQLASQSGWIHVAQLANSTQLTTWRNQYSLDAGELSTILLAKEIQADVALAVERDGDSSGQPASREQARFAGRGRWPVLRNRRRRSPHAAIDSSS